MQHYNVSASQQVGTQPTKGWPYPNSQHMHAAGTAATCNMASHMQHGQPGIPTDYRHAPGPAFSTPTKQLTQSYRLPMAETSRSWQPSMDTPTEAHPGNPKAKQHAAALSSTCSTERWHACQPHAAWPGTLIQPSRSGPAIPTPAHQTTQRSPAAQQMLPGLLSKPSHGNPAWAPQQKPREPHSTAAHCLASHACSGHGSTRPATLTQPFRRHASGPAFPTPTRHQSQGSRLQPSACRPTIEQALS